MTLKRELKVYDLIYQYLKLKDQIFTECKSVEPSEKNITEDQDIKPLMKSRHDNTAVQLAVTNQTTFT